MGTSSSPSADALTASSVGARGGIDLLQIQYFVEVTRTLSVADAARTLRLSQSALTRQIVALEQAIGVELFHRGPKGLTLTEAGSTALSEFTEFLAVYTKAIAEIAAPRVQPRQVFRLGVPWWVSIAQSSALEQCIKTSSHYNGIELEVVASSAGADAVRARQLDAAVVGAPVDDHDLTSTTFHFVDSCALVPAGHPLAKLEAIPLPAFAELPRFVMFARHRNPLQYTWVRERHAACGFSPHRIVHVEDPASMIQLVAAGQAAATFNNVAPKHLRFHGVAIRPLSPPDALRATVCFLTLPSAEAHMPEGILDAVRTLIVAHSGDA